MTHVEKLQYHAKKLGLIRGRVDARRYGADPANFDPSENPFGMDTEPHQHEAWAEGYEETFEALKP